MKSLEESEIQFVLASCHIVPHVHHITRVESRSEELRNNLLESLKIYGLI
jgi:hypothetical protein